MFFYSRLKNKSQSLQARLTFSALIFIVGASVAMGVVGVRLTANFENNRFRENFNLLAGQLARNAELGVLLSNKKMLERLADNMLVLEDVRGVIIRGREDALLVKRGETDMADNVDSVIVPVVTDRTGIMDSPFAASSGGTDEVVGKVSITYSRASLRQLVKAMAVQFLMVSLLLALVPVVMYWFLARAFSAPLKDILRVARDVSSGRLDVRAQTSSLQETNTLADAFNEMLDALAEQRRELEEASAAMVRQQSLAEVGKFSMVVAHEIKNPLAIIKGSLEILKKDDTPVEVKVRMVDFLEEEIFRINRLIEDFLLYARPRQPVFSSMETNELSALLADKIALLRDGMQAGVDVLANSVCGRILCDPLLLERALLNIVRNAIEAGDPDGVGIDMSCEGGGHLVIRVTDSGPGIPVENRERVFEPFFSTKSKGSGLGLATAREIIEEHGGTISVHDNKGGGACFEVVLPMLGQGKADG